MRELSNTQAELDVLSILSKKPEILFKYDVTLKPSAFSQALHQDIFRFIVAQYREGNSIIVPSLFTADPAAQAQFQGIIDHHVPTESFPSLVRTLNDMKSLRELRSIGDNIVYSVDESGDNGTSLLERYGSQISTLQQTNELDEIGDIASDLDDYYNQIEEIRRHVESGKGRPIHGPQTYTSLDNYIIGGLEPNDLAIFAATPSTGKTQFALQMAVANLKAGMPVAIFSLEMRKQQLFNRMLSQLTGVPGVSIKTGEGLSNEAMKRIRDGIEEMKTWKLFVDDNQTVNLSDILAKSKKLKFIEKTLGLIIVDYVTLVNNDLVDGPTHEKVGGVARSLKLLAGQINTPVVLVSQLRRLGSTEEERDPEPSNHDLRASGDLEANADIVLFLHATRAERRKTEPETKIYLGKNRNNPLGGIITKNRKNVQLFREERIITDL